MAARPYHQPGAAFCRSPCRIFLAPSGLPWGYHGRLAEIRQRFLDLHTDLRTLPRYRKTCPPHTRFGPAAEPAMQILPTIKACRKIPPWYPGAIAIQHDLDEDSIVRCCHVHPSLAPRQELPDTIPLIVTQGTAVHNLGQLQPD
jgi:hypothetical protein